MKTIHPIERIKMAFVVFHALCLLVYVMILIAITGVDIDEL